MPRLLHSSRGAISDILSSVLIALIDVIVDRVRKRREVNSREDQTKAPAGED